MTKAQILQSVRYYVNEVSTETGALLSDSANLLDFVEDAVEDVTLDLVPIMPLQLCTTETITLVANQANYTLTTTAYLQVYKVERYETGKPPKEIEIIDPLELQFHTNVGDTEADPDACYFLGDTLYFVKTPSTAKAYARVWLVQSEPATMATAGPTYLPRQTHRLVVYRTMLNLAPLMNANLNHFATLYNERLKKIERIWRGRFQQEPRFVRPSVRSRRTLDARDRAFFDKTGFFDD